MSKYIKSDIPRLSGLIQREKLLNKPSEVLDHPLTIISSAAGCGKTALATQIATEIEADVVWHSISQYEQDLRVFVLSLLQDLEVIAPDIQSLRVILQQALENAVYEITSYLDAHVKRDILIVIDDWHLITTEQADDWLKRFVALLPAKCHLLITSRSIPDLNMVELIASRRLLAIQQSDLFFTLPEVHYLASQLTSHRPTTEQIEAIWDKLQGWPVGTILALQPVTDILESYTPVNNDNPSISEALFQSISNQMLAQELPDIQRFLTWTSTGEYFNEELCQHVFSLTDSNFLIAEVLKRNLFVTQEAGGYRYHQLFRNFLQAHFGMVQNPRKLE
jgi:LuxR family transcriptional regulator, maltose regulon positive regulatory protein